MKKTIFALIIILFATSNISAQDCNLPETVMITVTVPISSTKIKEERQMIFSGDFDSSSLRSNGKYLVFREGFSFLVNKKQMSGIMHKRAISLAQFMTSRLDSYNRQYDSGRKSSPLPFFDPFSIFRTYPAVNVNVHYIDYGSGPGHPVSPYEGRAGYPR